MALEQKLPRDVLGDWLERGSIASAVLIIVLVYALLSQVALERRDSRPAFFEKSSGPAIR